MKKIEEINNIIKNLKNNLKNSLDNESIIKIKKLRIANILNIKFKELLFLADYNKIDLLIDSKLEEELSKILEDEYDFEKMDVFKLKRKHQAVEVIEFPICLNHSVDSFNFLFKLYQKIKKKKCSVIFDLKKTNFFSADHCSILGAILLSGNESKKYKIEIKNYSKKLENIFKSNHFSEKMGIKLKSKSEKLPVIYKEVDSTKIKDFENYIERYIILKLKNEMKEMITDSFIYDFSKVCRELFINVKDHSDSSNVYLCGQFNKSSKCMYFSIVNIGKTIREVINEKKPELINERLKFIIDWTLEKGNTTKGDNETGGLGLAKAMEFIEKTTGTFLIISGKEFYQKKYEDNNEKITKVFLKAPLKGTAIIMKISFEEKKYYENFIENNIENNVLVEDVEVIF